MLYHYLASDENGKITEADFEAESVAQVLQYLGGRSLRPIAVKPVRSGMSEFRRILGGRIALADKVFLTKYLSLMLKVGTDLLSAINILIADFDNPAMRALLLEVRDNLSRGRPFYEAFDRYPRVFSPVFVNLVKAAEKSGNLQHTFEELSVSLEREAELRGRLRAALVYPVILLVAAFAVFIFLVTFALPKIAKVFLESGIKPPFFSRVVFGVGLFVNDHIVAIIIAVLLVVGPGFYFFWKNPVGRRFASQLIGRLPVVRKIYRDIAIQRFASTFGALLKAGLPIVEATRLTASVIGSGEFRLSLLRVADEGLMKGLTIGEAFRRETAFPKAVTNLVAISEKAGHLDEVLATLAEFYASNVDTSVRSLVSFLEPALLLVMGMLVGSIALAIIVPIYQLTTQF